MLGLFSLMITVNFYIYQEEQADTQVHPPATIREDRAAQKGPEGGSEPFNSYNFSGGGGADKTTTTTAMRFEPSVSVSKKMNNNAGEKKPVSAQVSRQDKSSRTQCSPGQEGKVQVKRVPQALCPSSSPLPSLFSIPIPVPNHQHPDKY